jgi:hypothetical protein
MLLDVPVKVGMNPDIQPAKAGIFHPAFVSSYALAVRR